MSTERPSPEAKAPPNILLIIADQYRYPKNHEAGGFHESLNAILGFQKHISPSNPYTQYFPGLMKLRSNAVVLENHIIASSACTPSRGVIFTGQYGTKTGLTQTDGIFKSGDVPTFPWLTPDSVPTIGAWMKEAGYRTHYFGKWHLSSPSFSSLKDFGFDSWELSYPEPHGKLVNNLGYFRDPSFADLVCSFLRRQGLGVPYSELVANHHSEASTSSIPPWFAVCSFVNPHDIATYPGLLGSAYKQENKSFGPLKVPPKGSFTVPAEGGTMGVPMNRAGFPQDCATIDSTYDEKLFTKPSCQHDYSYKMGLALASVLGYNGTANMENPDLQMHAAVALARRSSIPFALYTNPRDASLDFIEFYAYLHYVMDEHVNRVLETLKESGQDENTIVILLTDHGENGAAHGMMMEKWHTAYEEVVHVPAVVQLPPKILASTTLNGMRHISSVTSHLDITPTILGLAGVSNEKRNEIANKLKQTHKAVHPLLGADLSPIILDHKSEGNVIEPDGSTRQAVFFMSDDEITAPGVGEETDRLFRIFEKTVDSVKDLVSLPPGPVKQPNHLRCVRTKDYKLVRYFDPNGKVPDEWEMYDLSHDGNEISNLVEVASNPPEVRKDLPIWADENVVKVILKELQHLLIQLEQKHL